MFHLFLNYGFSFSIWCNISKDYGRAWVVPGSCLDLPSLGARLPSKLKRGIPWKVAIVATYWAIWLERSKRIFDRTEESVDSI